MITIQLANTRPMPLNIMACRKCAEVIRGPESLQEFETGVCADKCFIEKVFHKLGGEHWEADIRSFIAVKSIPADTITFKLFKSGVEIAVLNDNTLGEYTASFTDHPLQTGFQLDFNKVFTNHGNGNYKVVTESTILGAAQPNVVSHEMKLYPYVEKIADGCVKIETYQNGSIESFAVDYTGLNWYQAIRIPGKFLIDNAPKKIKDVYQDSLRSQEQIQDEIQFEYLLSTEMLPSSIGNFLMIDAMLSNEYLVTDYNIDNYQTYRRKSVYPDSVSDLEPYAGTRKMNFEFKFTDKKLNNLKRNFS